MERLREYIEKWLRGEKVKGIDVSLFDIKCCIFIYNSILSGGKPEFLSSNVKEILDKCNIKVVRCNIGWRVV